MSLQQKTAYIQKHDFYYISLHMLYIKV